MDRIWPFFGRRDRFTSGAVPGSRKLHPGSHCAVRGGGHYVRSDADHQVRSEQNRGRARERLGEQIDTQLDYTMEYL